MKERLRKIFIWFMGFSLVFVFTFGKLNFNQGITYSINTEVVEEVDASLLLTAVGLVALSVFLSLGASHSADLIRTNASAFTSWYTNWYSDTSFADQNEWQTAHKAEEYLLNTGQVNSDGSLKNPDSVVLPKEILSNFYKSAQWYVNDYQTAGGIEWFKLSFTSGEHYVANVKGVETVLYDQSRLRINSSTNLYVVDSNIFTFQINEIMKTPSVFRLRIQVFEKSTGNLFSERYSRDLTRMESDLYAQNDGVLFNLTSYNTTARHWNIIPLFWNSDWEYSKSLSLNFPFNSLTATSNANSVAFPTQNAYLDISKYQGIDTSNDVVISDNGLPTNVDDSSNYFVVDTTQPTPPVTNLPVEDEADYTYVPITPDPSVPDVDIGTGMPTTPDHDLPDEPTASVPLPTIGDALDGTFMKDLFVWFGSWLNSSIESQTFFWDSAWGNLTTGINWLGGVIKDTNKNLRDAVLFPLNAIKNYMQSISEDGVKIEQDLASLSTWDMALTKDKFNNLVNQITLRIPCVNETLQAWYNVMAVSAHDLVSSVTIFGQTFEINTGQILQAFSGFGNLIKQAFRFVFWFVFLKGMRRRITSFLGLVSTER